ncbi:SHOCT domain-containing protein [Pseudaminobacter sp. NGMCC 1.201702]|uniref:SHOCT domain-containing protein n=1 Tax=Pseudaminobacter sp. NGMCC 1.201702 TaxID=3391825 RepID=UPI0039F0521D
MTAKLTRTFGFAALAALTYAAPALAQQTERYYYGPHMWGWGWFFGPVAMIGTLVLVLVVAAMAARWMGDRSGAGRTAPDKTAQDILAERFARGEIDKDEFEERRKLLGA